jgi:hypothetical protein
MFKHLAVIAAAVFVTACATVKHVPLSQEASTQLQGGSVALTHYPTADFAAFTAGKAAFAVIGAAAMISEGNSIVKENGIQDPAVAISQKLADKLVAARSVTIVSTQAVAANDEPQTLAATYAGAKLLLDVKTLNWMFNYYPSDWSHYKVTYSARVRLIDTASKKAIAETMCQTVQGDDANPPTKDQLLQNKAALLKEYLNKGVAACVDVLAKDLLRI